jgi:hypothetical protein
MKRVDVGSVEPRVGFRSHPFAPDPRFFQVEIRRLIADGNGGWGASLSTAALRQSHIRELPWTDPRCQLSVRRMTHNASGDHDGAGGAVNSLLPCGLK